MKKFVLISVICFGVLVFGINHVNVKLEPPKIESPKTPTNTSKPPVSEIPKDVSHIRGLASPQRALSQAPLIVDGLNPYTVILGVQQCTNNQPKFPITPTVGWSKMILHYTLADGGKVYISAKADDPFILLRNSEDSILIEGVIWDVNGKQIGGVSQNLSIVKCL